MNYYLICNITQNKDHLSKITWKLIDKIKLLLYKK